MPRLSDTLNLDVSLSFSYVSDGARFDFALRYKPFAQDLVDDLLASEETRDQARFNVRLLASCLTDWDMTDDQDQVLPITEDTIAALPMWCQNLLASRIMEDQQVGKRSGARLSATSRREAATTTNRYPTGSPGSKGAVTSAVTPWRRGNTPPGDIG